MTHETFDVRLNGEWMTATIFKPGDRVKNCYGDKGTVTNFDEGDPLFVNVDWDKDNPNKPGRTWMATSLSSID